MSAEVKRLFGKVVSGDRLSPEKGLRILESRELVDVELKFYKFEEW